MPQSLPSPAVSAVECVIQIVQIASLGRARNAIRVGAVSHQRRIADHDAIGLQVKLRDQLNIFKIAPRREASLIEQRFAINPRPGVPHAAVKAVCQQRHMLITLLRSRITGHDSHGSVRLDLAVIEGRKALGVEGHNVCQRIIRQQTPQNAEVALQQYIVGVQEADVVPVGMVNAVVARLA
ncbi:hypothetical protein D3C72_1313900 [compost metagenome]